MVAACSKKEWAGLAAFVKRWNCDHLPSKSSKNTATTKAKANVGNFARGSIYISLDAAMTRMDDLELIRK
jgi:hypothetical protein